ncbi:hypothetical protein Bbelb_178200, partial [Branchiostoma belcheri]
LNQSLQLPDSLHPLALLQGRLVSFLSKSPGGADSTQAAMDATSHALKRTASTGSLNFDEDSNTDQVCRSLQDLFTAATVAGAEAVPWLLERVVGQMQAVCSRLSTEVPAGLYLPAPPLYLPQPASISEIKKLPSNSLIEMPEGLATLLATGQDFRTSPSTAQPQGSVSAPSQSRDTLPEPTLRVVTSFRRLCGLLWMSDARERLSLCGRKLQTLREKAFQKHGNSDGEELELCKTALDWALCMLPFADYLDAEDDLQDIVLSLVGELPMTRTTGDILAHHFYDPELLSPTVEEKWNHLQTKMRKTRISVDQTTEQQGVVSKESKKQGSKTDGKTIMLSVYTHKKSGKQKKEIEKKAKVFGSYETQVFSNMSSDKKVCVGSWPFETEDSYLFFLETFFSVAFEKARQEEKGEKIPLLAPNKLEVREREVNSMAHKAMLTFQHKSLVVKAAMSFLGEASDKDIESKSLGKQSLSQSLSFVGRGKTERKRLFKSRSVADVNESETVRMGDVSAGGDDGKSSKKSLSQRRAASLSDLGQQRSPSRSWVSMTDLRPKVVNLGGKFDELTPLVEWLHRWSCKKNMMSPSVKDGALPGGGGVVDSKAVIRVRVPPSLVLTSFWLMENLYFKKQLSSSTLPVPPQEYVVYPAFSASIPRHVLESPTEASSSSWTPVLSSDSPTEEKVVPPPASMTSVTSMSPPRVEPKKKLSFASQPSTISPEETIRSEDSSTFNISSLADDESQATPTGQPITIPTPGSHLTNERPVASSTPQSAFGGQRSEEPQRTSFEKNSRTATQNETVIPGKGQAGSKGKGRVTTGMPVPSGSSSLPGFSGPKKGSTVAGSPSSSVEDAVNNVKEMRQLVRSELRSILEVQHQNIVSLLNSSGTVNVVVGKTGHNPGPVQGHTTDRQTQVSQELQVAQLEHIAAQVSPAAPASLQVQNGPQSSATHNPAGNPSAQPQVEPSIHNAQGRPQWSHLSVPLLRHPGFPDYHQNPVAHSQHTREPSTNPHLQNPSTFGNPHPHDNTTRPDNPGHNPGYAVPGSSLHPPGMPLLKLPTGGPFQRPVTAPFEAWGQSSRPAESHDHDVQVSEDDGNTGWPRHLNLEQYDAELVNSVGKKGAKKDRGPLIPSDKSKSKKSYNKPMTSNPTPQQEGAEGVEFPGAFAPAMPLLHLDNSYAPSQMMRGMYRMPQPQNNYPHFPTFPQPPVMSAPPLPPTDIEDVTLRLPLLHLRNDPQVPSYHYSFAPGMPRLVPPEEIIAYEQKKHQTEADIEPWDQKGDRENLNRQRRRMKKDSGVSQDVGKIQRKGGGREKEDRVSVTEDEDEQTHDEVPTPGVIVVQPSPGPDRTTQHKTTAEDTQDTAVPRDQGYVIPPGTFDEYLEYQTVVPTPAQIHYDAVVNKKAKPDTEVDTQTVHTEPERERTKPHTTAEKETNTVIVVSRDVYSAEQAVSQYAASGMDVSRGGPGLPPDIFFNLRFGREAAQATDSGAGQAPAQRQDQEVQTPAFLNVVDIDNSLLKDLKPTRQPRQQRQRTPETRETEEEHRRSQPSGLPDDATPADLHYRLAGLTNSVKPAEVDDEGNIREPPGGDSLTVDLLSSVTGESPVNLSKIRRDTAGIRAKSRERLADKLTEMGRQLDAIDQMATNMEDDFKNTRLLVNTIDHLGEAIHPEEESVARRPRGRGQQYDSRRHDNNIPPVVDEEEEKIQADRNLERLLDMTGLSGVSDIIAEVFAEGGLKEEDLGISLTGADLTRDSRLPSEPFASTQLSVDTLQDVFSPRQQDTSTGEDEKRAKRRKEVQKWMLERRTERRSEYLKQLEELRSTEHQRYKPAQDSPKQVSTEHQRYKPAQDSPKQVSTEHQRYKPAQDSPKQVSTEHQPYKPAHDSPKQVSTEHQPYKPAQDSPKQVSTEHQPYKPAQDSPKQVSTEHQPYKPAQDSPKQVSTEHQPYKPAQDSPKQVSTEHQPYKPAHRTHLNRSVQNTSRTNLHRTHLNRALLRENMSERVKQAYDLMGDIVIDTPELPASNLPPPSVKKKKPARPGSSARGHSPPRKGLPKSSIPIPRSQTWRMQDTGFDVDEYDVDDAYLEELLQDSGEAQRDMLQTYKVRDVSKIGEQSDSQGGRRPKPFTTLVRQQRPEAARKQASGKPKTYAERLAEANASKIPRPAFNKLRDKQRLYGASGGPAKNRMQEVTRRGLYSEPKPRKYASTYAQRLQSQQPDTGRRGGRVSPRQPVGKRFEGPRHKPKTYSQQLQEISAAAPKGRPRLAYTGTSSRGLKSPSMRTQTLRHAPYPDVYESVLEDISEASTASLLRSTSDDVRRILQEEDIFGDGGARPKYRDYPDYDAASLYDVGDDILGDDYITSVDPDQLSQASQSTGSILSNINWDEVEQLIATVE